MKRLLYFAYFVKTTDYKRLLNSFQDVKGQHGLSYPRLFRDMIYSAFRYGASFHDYFMFEFYKKDHDSKDAYLTTSGSYEFYTSLNDRGKIMIFENKNEFNKVFKSFISREHLFLEDCDVGVFDVWLDGKTHIVAKPHKGVAGKGIQKIKVKKYSKQLYRYLLQENLLLVEDCIVQHPKMDKLNPASVNTIRIITVNHNGQIDIVGAILRMGTGNFVDNFSAGGIAAPIDLATGKVFRSAISKYELQRYECHPVTKHRIKGFQIPFWDECLDMVVSASKIIPSVRTVGWDIAITEGGPEMIEGNHNWNKDSFQLPYGEGRRALLEKYIKKTMNGKR